MSTHPCGCDFEAKHYSEECTKRGFCRSINAWLPITEGKRAIKADVRDLTRKTYPVATGVLSYFPLAIMAVAHVSYLGNEQHHPGQPLHWDRTKSTDEADALMRHFLARGTLDTDGAPHSAKVAWRALALLEKELEAGNK